MEQVELEQIKPDALLVGTRNAWVPPAAGQPEESGYVTETVRLTRYDKMVTLTLMAAEPWEGDVRLTVADDAETAEVAFSNEAEALRRDGWTLREADPWEVADPAETEGAPF